MRPVILMLLLLISTQVRTSTAGGGPMPLRVWIDGENLDGTPLGAVRPPGSVGLSLWPTSVRTKLRLLTGPTSQIAAQPDPYGTLGATAFLRVGSYWTEVDVSTMSQPLLEMLATPGGFGAQEVTLERTDVVLRGAREIWRYHTVRRGDLRFDLGLRATFASWTVTRDGVEASDNRFVLSPEFTVGYSKPLDRQSGLHARLSYADSGYGARWEQSAEGLVAINYHALATQTYLFDLSVGWRLLQTRLGFPDAETGQESTFKNVYNGPEVMASIRF